MSSRAERLLTLFAGRSSEFAMGRPETDDRGRIKIVYRPSGRPLTLADLDAHMDGTGPIVGVYVLREDAHCKFAAFDIDKQDLLAAEKLRDIAVELGFPENASMLVDSGSKGYHLHFFFEEWVSGQQARAFLRTVAARAGMHEKRNVSDSDGIEFFPKQDGFSEHLSYGSLIKLPLVIHPATGRRADIVKPKRVVPAPPSALLGVLGSTETAEGGTSAPPSLESPTPPVAGTTEASGGAMRQAPPLPVATHAITQDAEAHPSTQPSPEQGLVMEGGRNSFLASMAGKLRREGLDQAAIQDILLSSNQRVCVPPLPDNEVRTIARSVSRYPAGQGDTRLHPPTTSRLVEAGEVEGIERRGRARILKLGLYDQNAEAMGIRWLIDQWLIRGQLTLTVGQEKLGKSTQAWHRVAAVSRGDNYLGQRTNKGRVLVFTEMAPDTVRTLLDEDDIYPSWENVDVMVISDYDPKERMTAFADAVKGQDYVYCLLDPLDECLGLDADAVISSSSTADGFDLLKSLSSDLGVCVEGLYHFNKIGKIANSYKFSSKPDHLYELKGSSPAEITVSYRGRTRQIPRLRKITGNGNEGYEVVDLEGKPLGRPSRTQQKVLTWMRTQTEPVTPGGVAAACDLSYGAATMVLARMVRLLTISRVGEGLYAPKGVSLVGSHLNTKPTNENTNEKGVPYMAGVSLVGGEGAETTNARANESSPGVSLVALVCPQCGSSRYYQVDGKDFCFDCLVAEPVAVPA